jgi:carbon-monoxide dehydrogenase large subunit
MHIGKPLLRDEDFKYLRGRGRFTDEIPAAGAVRAAFVRSPHAHARIAHVSTEAAAAMPGVLAVLTAADWAADGLGELTCIAPVDFTDGRPMQEALRPALAADKVCHVGDTVVAVIAETRYQAMDAAEAVEVGYEPLPAVTDAALALAPDSPVLHERLGANLCQSVDYGDAAATDAAFARAHHVTRFDFRHGRAAGCAIEPRAYLGQYDPAENRYTLWAACQNPHFLRNLIAKDVLHIPIGKLRVVAPDVGGGFGPKYFCYPELPIVLWAARRVGRPVRWSASRAESMITDTHARDIVTTSEMAFDEAGRVLAMRCHSFASYGAYVSTFAPTILVSICAHMATGPYRIPAAHVTLDGVYTNTTPVDAYRGVKQAPAFVHEMLIEKAARELGMDPAELRLRNYIQHEDYPYTNAMDSTYDSGDMARQHATMAGLIDYDALRAEARAPRADGLRLGIGISAIVESAGLGPSRIMGESGSKVGGWEAGQVRVHPDGKATIFVGTHSHGQSHEITFRQVVADGLGLDIADIEFTQGDTDLGPGNLGTAASRSLSTAGMALVEGSRRIVAKATKLAAHMMECAAEDVSYAGGIFSIPGTDREVSFARVAEMAYHGVDYPEEDFELGLEETVFHDPSHFNYPTALHIAVVLVDPETGAVHLREFHTVDDCGRIVNPMVAHGQIHGGAAQGIGQGLMEHVVYDPDSGQPLAGSFMDYAMPRAADLPSFNVAFQETLNPNDALGAKGCSESATVSAPGALGNAVLDALWGLGVRHIDMPYSPQRVWRAIQDAGAE